MCCDRYDDENYRPTGGGGMFNVRHSIRETLTPSYYYYYSIKKMDNNNKVELKGILLLLRINITYHPVLFLY